MTMNELTYKLFNGHKTVNLSVEIVDEYERKYGRFNELIAEGMAIDHSCNEHSSERDITDAIIEEMQGIIDTVDNWPKIMSSARKEVMY